MSEARSRMLYTGLRLAERCAEGSSRSAANPELHPFGAGISVIIPERANPQVLAETLEHAVVACQKLDEPWEIIVVVNGSPAAQYRRTAERHRQVTWLYSAQPLWYLGAIRRGLLASHYDWVYLLNSDMLLDPAALEAVLPWRDPGVFGIASQVYFRDPRQRREETGWTKFRIGAGPIEILDEVAPDEDTVRGTFYAGGGASLFRRYLLIELTRDSRVYLPFYWEDVEWGARAWRLGYRSIYCPASKAWHLHRMTNRLLFPEAEIDRILERNRVMFHLRNGPAVQSLGELRDMLHRLERQSSREILGFRRMAQVVQGRFQSQRLPLDHIPLDRTWTMRYGTVMQTEQSRYRGL